MKVWFIMLMKLKKIVNTNDKNFLKLLLVIFFFKFFKFSICRK